MPAEKGGAGANGYTYFVCNQLGGALSCLPSVKPSHIRAARQVKKFVSGKLDAQVRMADASYTFCLENVCHALRFANLVQSLLK